MSDAKRGEAHLYQAQERTKWKITTSLDYSEQMQKNNKRCRQIIIISAGKNCEQEKTVQERT